MAIVRYTAEEAKLLKGNSDFERARALNEEELEAAAKSDPDSAWPTEDELKQFKRQSEFKKSIYVNKKSDE